MTQGPAMITRDGPPKMALPAFTWVVVMASRSSGEVCVSDRGVESTRAWAREILRFAQDDTEKLLALWLAFIPILRLVLKSLCHSRAKLRIPVFFYDSV